MFFFLLPGYYIEDGVRPGTKILVFQNQLFYKNYSTNNKIGWLCKESKKKCSARVVTVDNIVVRTSSFHNH